uniref:Uncharacterized protein n=1 Tax=Rhizophora mucronata TaxID=61149 RepID=A0A2P2NM04_RHIMU
MYEKSLLLRFLTSYAPVPCRLDSILLGDSIERITMFLF